MSVGPPPGWVPPGGCHRGACCAGGVGREEVGGAGGVSGRGDAMLHGVQLGHGPRQPGHLRQQHRRRGGTTGRRGEDGRGDLSEARGQGAAGAAGLPVCDLTRPGKVPRRRHQAPLIRWGCVFGEGREQPRRVPGSARHRRTVTAHLAGGEHRTAQRGRSGGELRAEVLGAGTGAGGRRGVLMALPEHHRCRVGCGCGCGGWGARPAPRGDRVPVGPPGAQRGQRQVVGQFPATEPHRFAPGLLRRWVGEGDPVSHDPVPAAGPAPRAQAVDSLHSVANELLQPLITPTPGPAQRSALACADALRAAATVLADHDNDPGTWTPDELQHGDTAATNHAAESPTLAAAPPTPPTDAPPPPPPPPTDAPPPPQYPPGLDVSKYVRAPLPPQHPGRT